MCQPKANECVPVCVCGEGEKGENFLGFPALSALNIGGYQQPECSSSYSRNRHHHNIHTQVPAGGKHRISVAARTTGSSETKQLCARSEMSRTAEDHHEPFFVVVFPFDSLRALEMKASGSGARAN